MTPAQAELLAYITHPDWPGRPRPLDPEDLPSLRYLVQLAQTSVTVTRLSINQQTMDATLTTTTLTPEP